MSVSLMTRRPERVQTTIAIRNSRQYACPKRIQPLLTPQNIESDSTFGGIRKRSNTKTLPTETADSGVVG